MLYKRQIKRFSTDLFQKYISEPLQQQEDLHLFKFYQTQRQLAQVNKKIDNDKFYYDANIVTNFKQQRLDIIIQEIDKLNISEFNYLIFQIINSIKKNSPKDKTLQNLTMKGFQEFEQKPIGYLDEEYRKRQQIIGDLTILGPENFSKILQAFGGISEQTETQEVEEKVEQKVEQQVEKTNFDVELTSFDASSKIKIIKEIRGILNLGLKEAKDLVEKAPVIIQNNIPKEKAEELANKLKELGCVTTLV